MSRRTLFRCVMVEGERPMRLEYYLLTDDALFDGGSLEVYGVEILCYRPGVRRPEIARLRGITPLGRRILDILQKLCDGTVTPSALREVMDSILARG